MVTAAQMIDGLALGETTPGPLIMVVAFVGFVGGWTKELFGTESLLLAGAAGAVVATYFTFLPSFIFIFMGAPFVETTHGNLKFTAPLTGITAAVVGVIVNLAVFFAYHVLWPRGLDGPFDWISALIGTATFVAMFRFKAGIMTVVGGAARPCSHAREAPFLEASQGILPPLTPPHQGKPRNYRSLPFRMVFQRFPDGFRLCFLLLRLPLL